MIKVFRSPRFHFLFFEETGKCARGCLGFGCELFLFEVRPRRAGGLAVCTGLESPRARRCCGTKERSIGIDYSGNPSCVEGGDVEQVCSNLETNPLCLRLFTLSLCLSFISCILLLSIFICLIYSFVLIDIHAWVVC